MRAASQSVSSQNHGKDVKAIRYMEKTPMAIDVVLRAFFALPFAVEARQAAISAHPKTLTPKDVTEIRATANVTMIRT